MNTIRIAASQHLIEAPTCWDDYARRMEQQVADASRAGARLLIFPEYGSLVLVPLLSPAHRLTLKGQLNGLQAFAGEFNGLFAKLAAQYQVWIVAPSFPLSLGGDHIVNRVWIQGPAGELHWQDKHHMTRFENELFALTPGTGLTVVDAGDFRFGVAICYDSEFPQQVHALALAGAQVIAVPSCTDSLAGYHRVLLCSRARAVENQCFVAQAPLRGEAPWCDAIDINVGQAGIFSPVDRGFPDDGILAMGSSENSWVLAECNLDAMATVRADGQVLNWLDHQRYK